MPTPNDLAGRRTAALAARPQTVMPAPPAPAVAAPSRLEHYDHLVRRAGLHPHTVAVACALVAYADPETLALGRRTPTVPTLARATGLGPHAVRTHLHKLRLAGWMSRPAPREGVAVVRPITLTIPDAAAAAMSGPS